MTDPLTGDPTIGADGSVTVGAADSKETPMTEPRHTRDDNGDGVPDVTPAPTSTQVAHPWRASLRSGLASLVPILVLCVVAVPEIVRVILEVALDQGLDVPTELRGILAAASVACSFLVAVANRLMLLPTVNAILTRLGAGPRPATES